MKSNLRLLFLLILVTAGTGLLWYLDGNEGNISSDKHADFSVSVQVVALNLTNFGLKTCLTRGLPLRRTAGSCDGRQCMDTVGCSTVGSDDGCRTRSWCHGFGAGLI